MSATPARRGPYGRSRAELAAAAIACFEQRGFAETTVQEIAARAGYTERTFFRQFATKEEVVFFDLPDILRPLQDLLLAPLTLTEAWQAVSEVVIANSETWQAADADLARRRTRLFHQEPALARRFLEIAADWEAVLAEVFAAARGTDPAGDTYAQVLAIAVTGVCRSALNLWLFDGQRSLAAHTRTGLALLESGFGLVAGGADA